MLNAKEAKKYRDECIRKKLEENLNQKIMEACEKGESSINISLNETEVNILNSMGYKVKHIACDSFKISWA